MTSFSKSILVLASLAMTAPAYAVISNREYSYSRDDAKGLIYGNAKAETYDVAIRLDNPALVGTQITGISVPFPADATISNASGWLSSELKLEKKVNVPDITSAEATVSEDNLLTVSFDQPYTITDAPVYVGYTFSIPALTTNGDKNPIYVTQSSAEDGLYIHSSRTVLKWKNKGTDLGAASMLRVVLQGDFPEYGVRIDNVKNVRASVKEENTNVYLSISNFGEKPVSSIGYTYQYGDNTPVVGSLLLDTPISNQFAMSHDVTLSIPTNPESCNLRLSVNEVDGKPNEIADASFDAKYSALQFLPTMRPLMEEYTGLWCGWCPRGYVAMEQMTELYPEDFVCVSFHSGDVYLQYVADEEFPGEVDGYPGAIMNRYLDVDPYYGTANDGLLPIKEDWLRLRQNESLADIDVRLEWADEARSKVKFTSDIKFCEDVNGNDYSVDYILIGNGFQSIYKYDENNKVDLKNSIVLSQSNSYNSYTHEKVNDPSPVWDLFFGKGNPVNDIVFNDIAMHLGHVDGETLLPEVVKANEVYTNEYTIDYATVANAEEEPRNILPASGNLSCVVVLLDADGNFVNCNKSKVSIPAGIDSGINLDKTATTPVAEKYFDLQGREIANPTNGFYICNTRLSDGSTIRRTVVKK